MTIRKTSCQKQKIWSITWILASVVAFSVILVTSACQTSSQSGQARSDTELSEDFKTSLSIALSYLDSGRPDKAMHELQALLAKKPNNIEALNLMGITQLALSNPRRAVIHLEKAWKLDSRTPTGVNLSSAYLELERFKDAEKLVIALLKRKETPPYAHIERIYHNYALIAEKTNRAILAEKMYKKAVEENPMFYLSHMQLARIYLEKKKHSLAIKQLEAARFGCPVCFDPVAQLVRIQSAKGDLKTARQLVIDYKLTEGLTQNDRRRAIDLENSLTATAGRVIQDVPAKNR